MRTSSRIVVGWLCRVLAIFAIVWVVLYAIHVLFPNIQPGADMVYDAKNRIISSERVYPENAAVRVAMFGNSKTLSGFDPVLFDSLSGGRTVSYNAGLANSEKFIDNIEAMCRQGQAPTHVLLQFPWTDQRATSSDVFRPAIDDGKWMRRLFPFRRLPRNLFLFLLRSRTRGGVVAFYHYVDEQIQIVIARRGYYFIEGQSHYPGHHLPDDFSLVSDTPAAVDSRKVRTDVPEFERLRSLAARYGFVAYLVPSYVRNREYAEPPSQNVEIAAALAPFPQFAVLGPDYFRLPSRMFSDPVHLNPEGAEYYTGQLWAVLRPRILMEESDPQEAKGHTFESSE